MRKLIAKLVNGEITRRDFTARVLGMGFGMMTVESILDTVTIAGESNHSAKNAETFHAEPFSPWRIHKNTGRAAASFISVTDLPLVMDLYHNADFIFNNDFVFRDRYNNQPDYFTVNESKMKIAGSAATFGEGEKGAVGVLDTGLIPDLNQIQLFAAKARGLKNKSAEVILSDNSMQTHVSEFEIGTYKRAHRHGH